MKKVFVSGCYDLLHSGHVEFFKQAAEYGDLYVGIGSDATIREYKHHSPMFPEQERLFMVRAVRYVKDAFINDGHGVMDFVGTVERLKPDVLIVNSDGGSEEKRQFCIDHGIEYVVLERIPHDGLASRSSTGIKTVLGINRIPCGRSSAFPKTSEVNISANALETNGDGCTIPTRLDLAGTWIDQPYVSFFHPGWALTISLEPTFQIRERCGLSTSTRNQIRQIWPFHLPDMDPEMLSRLVFCFENHPEREGGIISGAQDAIGICMPGLVRHYYDNHFWPLHIESCHDDLILNWLEQHLCLIPLEPRDSDCSVVEGKDINASKVAALASAADECWNAIMKRDLKAFADAYQASFHAQIAMFPAMIQGCVQTAIDFWSEVPGVLAWKLPGAGGGGYLALVVTDAALFCREHSESIDIHIRRKLADKYAAK